jgi:hypothetical protein
METSPDHPEDGGRVGFGVTLRDRTDPCDCWQRTPHPTALRRKALYDDPARFKTLTLAEVAGWTNTGPVTIANVRTTGSPQVFWRLSSVEGSSGPVKTHPRHHRVLIGREPTTTWTASKQLPRPIRVLSASRKRHITFPLRTATLGT